MAIKNYTTSVPAVRTVGQIQDLLVEKGAQQVSVDYSGGVPVAISFTMGIQGTVVPFRLEARPTTLLKVLEKQRVERRYRTHEQAERVAWRLVKDWIDVQLAFIEAGQAALEQLLLGYAVTRTGETFWDLLAESGDGQKLLAEHL